MFAFLKRLFGLSKSKPALHNSDSQICCSPDDAPAPDQQQNESAPAFTQEALDFLLALMDIDAPPLDLQLLPHADRAFLSNNIGKICENSFEMPMLPHAAICIQQLLSDPAVEVSDFIDVIKEDPTLSVELLRMANSSYLGFTTPTLDLQQAIIRIGFSQLHGLVTMLSLRSRILKGTYFQKEVEWVVELSLSMAKLCQQLAPELNMKPDEAFTVGLLNHIEYLVILGEASQYSTENPGNLIARETIAETVHRLGNSLHELITDSWELGAKPAANPDDGTNPETNAAAELRMRLSTIQRSLVYELGGKNQLIDTAGFETEKVKQAVAAAIAPSAR